MGVKSVLFLLLAVAATSYADTKCCFPNQFVLDMGEKIGLIKSGKGSATTENAHFAFDYINKRTGALRTVTQDGKSTLYQTIADYNKGAEYVIQPKMRNCQKTPLAGPMDHCVPAHATFTNWMYLGDQKLTVVNYHYSAANTSGSMSFTADDCIPSSIIMAGDLEGDPYLAAAGYYNYVSGIKDPSMYFTVPSYCPTTFSNEPRMYDMRRFRTFP